MKKEPYILGQKTKPISFTKNQLEFNQAFPVMYSQEELDEAVLNSVFDFKNVLTKMANMNGELYESDARMMRNLAKEVLKENV